MTRDDIARIARFLAVPEAEFTQRYLRLVRGRVSFREKANGDCVFFTRPHNRCSIYPVRPTQCRTYPFWPEVLRSEDSWEEEAEYCPGVGGGKHWPAEVCEELLRRTRDDARRTARALAPDGDRRPTAGGG